MKKNYGTELIEKYNAHHDARGRFTTAGNATFVSTRIKRAGGGETYHDVASKFREAYQKQKPTQNNQSTRSVLFPKNNPPKLGVPVKHNGQLVVFEKAGKHERINENSPSLHGSHLLGYEGESGQHYHYRLAEEKAGTIETDNKKINELSTSLMAVHTHKSDYKGTTYVARITGSHPKYKFNREFLAPDKKTNEMDDYSNAITEMHHKTGKGLYETQENRPNYPSKKYHVVHNLTESKVISTKINKETAEKLIEHIESGKTFDEAVKHLKIGGIK